MKTTLRTTVLSFLFLTSSYSQASTTVLSGNTFQVLGPVSFSISHQDSTAYVFTWTDEETTYNALNPNLLLGTNHSFTLNRISNGHPLALADSTLPVQYGAGLLSRSSNDFTSLLAAIISPSSTLFSGSNPIDLSSPLTLTPLEVHSGSTIYYTSTNLAAVSMTGSISFVTIPEPSVQLLSFFALLTFFLAHRMSPRASTLE